MDQRVALVTGASSGLGAHIAIYLASLGYALSLSGRNLTALKDTARKCAKAGLNSDEILVVPGDLRLEEAVENLVHQTLDKFGQLDVLINSAGVVYYGSSSEVSMDTFNKIFDTNVKSVFHLSQQVLPHLKITNGSIINLSAGCTKVPMQMIYLYCASKAALDYMTRSMALEMGSHGVRINAVSLTSLPTGIHERAHIPEDVMATYFNPNSVVLRRNGELDDVSYAVAFLANHTQSSFITGHILPIRGGNQLYEDLDMF